MERKKDRISYGSEIFGLSWGCLGGGVTSLALVARRPLFGDLAVVAEAVVIVSECSRAS